MFHREIGVQTDLDDDEVFDMSPTSTLQRSSITSQASPRANQPGLFARMRNSFSNSKIKEMKKQIRALEEDVKRQDAELVCSRKTNAQFTQRLSQILKENPFHLQVTGNVQVGDNNIQDLFPDDLVANLDNLSKNLAAAVQINTEERTRTEIQLKKNEILLKEMKDSLELCNTMVSKLDKTTANKLGQVKCLLESLTSDRSDERVITDGMVQLRQYVIDRQRFVRTVETTPWDVQVAVNRLVNKFGHLSWQQFAELIDVCESSIQARGWVEEDDDTNKQTTLLEKDMCARILAQWITQSEENDAQKLLDIIASYEIQTSKAMTLKFQKTTVGQSANPVSNVPNQRFSMASSTSGRSGSFSLHSQKLPDNRSQFEHQLEAWKLQVEMNGKLDEILNLMKNELRYEWKKDVNSKLSAPVSKRVVNDGHFV